MSTKKKTKIIIRIVIGIVLILAVVICVARCDRKQYVTIRIACQEGDESLNVDLAMSGDKCQDFPMGTDEIYWSIPYDGVKRRYGVFAYSVSRRAESEKDGVLITHHWIQYSSSDNFFVRSSTYISPEGEVEGSVSVVKDIGEYIFSWSTRNPDWGYRSVTLHVTVYDPNDNDKEK